MRLPRWIKFAVSCSLLVALALFPGQQLLIANPENPEVRHGDVEFNFENPGELFIDQFSDRAIIDWESFSIDSGELTRFIQPSSSSAALSRVFSGSPSEIHGRLEANGQIFLINPNGILVGPSGAIDTAGFLGSTLDVSDAEFMNGGDMTFSGGSGASVVNLGTINAIDGGDIFLIAKNVVNEGSLHASEGTIGLAAGQEVRVAAAGEERVSIAPGGEGSVTNKGQIQAMTAELKAAGGNQYALAINNEGMVRAKSFETRGGRLYLSAGGGRIVNTGSAQASKSVSVTNTGLNGSAEIGGVVRAQDEETGNGGKITIAAPNVEVLAGGRVDASGVEAGSVAIQATVIGGAASVNGDVRASSDAGVGGVVSVTGETIEVGATGSIRADGATDGGLVMLGRSPGSPYPGAAPSRDSNGQEQRNAAGNRAGYRDPGLLLPATSISTAAGSTISASGQSGNGGDVLLFADTAAEDSEMRLGGQIRANGGGGHGGEVLALGSDVRVEQTSLIRANGETDGGLIRVEGEGDVVVAGKIQARGSTGDGGFVHVSGENVTFTETSEVDARGGRDGGFIEVEGGEEGTVSIAGQLLASGGRDGGMIAVSGGDVIVTQSGLLDASGARDGGFVSVDGSGDVHVAGRILAMGGDGDGGVISVTGENVTVGQTGLLDASGGNNGGMITVDAENNATFNGTARAVGGSGDGGAIQISGANGVNVGPNALLDASGAVNGGAITLDGGDGSANMQGTALALGGTGVGGSIAVTGATINTSAAAELNASGDSGGGRVRVGGGRRGEDPQLQNATDVTIDAGAILAANALGFGDGGEVIAFAENRLDFFGTASAAGGQIGGDGGFIEVSGKQQLQLGNFVQNIDVSASNGTSGVFLIDPLTVTIGPPPPNTPIAGSPVNDQTFLADTDISAFLATGSLIIETGAGAGTGDIRTEAAANITWGTGSTLTLNASRNVIHGGTINATGAGNISVTANAGAGSILFLSGSSMSTNGGQISFDATNGDIRLQGTNSTISRDAANVLSVSTGTVAIDDPLPAGNAITADFIDEALNFGPVSIASTGDINFGASAVISGFEGNNLIFTSGGNIAVDNNARIQSDHFSGGNLSLIAAGAIDLGNARIETETGSLTVRGQSFSIGGAPNLSTGSGGATFAAQSIAVSDAPFAGSSQLTAGLVSTSLGSGPVTIETTDNIDVRSNVFYDSQNDLTFLAGADVNFDASVQNRNDTGGAINIVAGWDGTTAFDAATFLAEDHRTTTVYGQNMGAVNVGDGTQTTGVTVGARSGNSTNVFGYDINVLGATGNTNSHAQIGFKVSGGMAIDGTDLGALPDVNGAINVRAQNAVNVTAGRSYAQIGHIGFDGSGIPDANTDAPIDLRAGGKIAFTGGDHDLFTTYAQIGHGGAGAIGTFQGSVTVRDSGSLEFFGGRFFAGSYAQIGHGGAGSIGNHSGDILIDNVGDLTFSSASTPTSRAPAHLGHGGYAADGAYSGAITVRNSGDFTFTAGRDASWVLLGHGGYQEDTGGNSGDILIENVGDIVFTGGIVDSFAQLGHGGFESNGAHSGSITLRDTGDITFDAYYAHAQLGHGGHEEDIGDNSGDILIENVGDITLKGELDRGRYAQIGHGGRRADGAHSGDITIRNAGNLTFEIIEEPESYVQVGHGGAGENSGDNSGDILITNVGDIALNVAVGAFSLTDFSYAQIGHGGFGAANNHSGAISVNSNGSISLTGVNHPTRYALIGHGDSPTDTDAGQTVSGDLTIQAADNLTLSHAFLGHQIDNTGTYASGKTHIGVGGDLTADANSQFTSAPAAAGGELRFYLPTPDGWLGENANLNNAAQVPANEEVLNNMGPFDFGAGPYRPDLAANGNYAFYTLLPPAADALRRVERIVGPGAQIGIVPAARPGENPALVITVFDPLSDEAVQQLLANPFFDIKLIDGAENQLPAPPNPPVVPGSSFVDGFAEFLPEEGNVTTKNSGEVSESETEEDE